jgi:hypothetical protein
VSFATLGVNTFLCDKDAVLSAPESKSIEIKYQTKILLSGSNKTTEASVELDMSKDYFDSPGNGKCKLSNFDLTKITTKEGLSLKKEDWKEIISFNKVTKSLKIENQSKLNLTEFEEVKLIF